ncbi:MAG: nucleoside deaminase [Clostridia bacterium]|nr:nucleoside deaminase [Clostridia bacterium]
MTDEELMRRALALAKEAAAEGEVPVGAVIAKDGEIVAEGRNRRELGKNALYHAEMEAIDTACKKLDGWRLPGCTLYVTLEPCPMCAGAVINARVERLVFGAYDKKAGSVKSVADLFLFPYNHKPAVTSGFLETECAKLLTDFFADLRKQR